MRISRISITRGVLPVPPTVMLPTTTTGTRARHAGRICARYANRRAATIARKISASGKKMSAPPPNRCHSDSSQALISRLVPRAPDLPARLRRERNVVVSREPRALHHVDHGLVRGQGIGADGDHRLLRALRGLLERVGEGLGAAEGGRGPVDRVLAGRIDRDVEHLGALRGAVRRRLREIDLQLRVAAVGRGQEQEDQDDDEDIDQLDQVDVGLFARSPVAKVHARRSPWMISISLIAWLSISTTSTSTRLRKWR